MTAGNHIQNTFNKQQKLKSKKLLDILFTKSKSFTVYPIKVFFVEVEEPMDFPVKVGVGVSGRNFKRAVQRNRIKRLLREHYRLNKLPLLETVAKNHTAVAVFFLYIDKVLPNQADLALKMPLAIEKLTKQLHRSFEKNDV